MTEIPVTKDMQSPGDSGKPDYWDEPLTLELEIEEAESLGIDCSALREQLDVIDRSGAT